MHLIEVAFKGNRKEFFTWDGEDPPPLRARRSIVEADRGEDLGVVHAIGELAQKRNVGMRARAAGRRPPTRKALRVAATARRPPGRATSARRTKSARRTRPNGSRRTGS